MKNTAHRIPILQKAVLVLETLAGEAEPPTAAALARRLNVAGASCYRILQTLLERGWVRQLPHGGYTLGVGLLPLARSVIGHDPLAPWYPAVEAFARTHGWTCKLSIRRDDDAVTVHRVEGSRQYAIAVRMGTAFPIAYGSSGAALLVDASPTELEALIARAPAECWRHQSPDQLRCRIAEAATGGVACDRGGFRPDIVSCSVPLRNQSGQVVAAATALGFAADETAGELERIAAAFASTFCRQESGPCR